MKKILVILMVMLTFYVNGQNRDKIISLMDEYVENYGKPNYDFDFVHNKLNPTIQNIERLTCESNDSELFDCFVEMILKTKGSANEIPANILGGIFICKPKFVEKQLTENYKDEFLISLLEFGFNNKTHNQKEKIKNYKMLKKKLHKLKNK